MNELFGGMRGLSPRKKELETGLGAFELFQRLYAQYSSVYLLESMETDAELARYSFIGFNPAAKISARDGVLAVDFPDGKRTETDVKNPFDSLAALPVTRAPLPFLGGLVGYVSYEAVKYFEPGLELAGRDEVHFPDFEFGLFLDGIVFDRGKRKCFYVTTGEDRSGEVLEAAGNCVEEKAVEAVFTGASVSKEGFEARVGEALEKIRAGETFQTVLSRRMDFNAPKNKCGFYERLRKTNPSPYMYYLKFGDREIIGSSPEMLARLEGKQVETFPIAGTRPRGKTPAEDARLAKEMLASEKERAEHMMLVDLARNDAGRVCEFGSVKVEEMMAVKKFSHVQHIVSKVVGKTGKNAFDVFKALFPAGTVSGAPKYRAMEIISELEGTARGPYAGAVGYFSFNGNCDFAITIRTLFADGKKTHIQSGAGIVYDSVPEKEYAETIDKARALVGALGVKKPVD
ncbi:MAG: anthranilate synthase component I family protein [Candidatus Micrarchaeota archaeon]|nr:anthranilate synthase component I family protein [Candidatus Micrarchaeota archaeon]